MNPLAIILEDDRPTGLALEELVEREGFDVHVVGSIGHAKRWVERRVADFAVLDLKLPDGLSIELLQHPNCGRFAKVVVTAYPSFDSTVEALRRHATDYLVKPIEPERLIAIARQVYQRSSMQNQIDDMRPLVGRSIPELEKSLILATLEKLGGNKTKAARTLGISLKTLYNKLSSYQQNGH